MPKPRRPRRSTIAATGVVLVFVCCASMLALGLFVQRELRPVDGPFGEPQQLVFPLCGRSYALGRNAPEATKAQIDAEISAGYEPYVLEPTIGKIPLLDVLTKCPAVPMVGGHGSVTLTVIWLHLGPDEYVAYALEGGP